MIKIARSTKEQIVFYAENDAALYDDTVELTQACYWQLHGTMIQLLRYHFKARDTEEASRVRGTILDAGCGTGAEGLATLAAFPRTHLVAIDFSSAMLDRFRATLLARSAEGGLADRCTLVCRDLFGSEVSPAHLLTLLPREEIKTYRAVISAFALHHYEAEAKARLYSIFHDVLEPGGILVNGDLFSYWSQSMARQAQQQEEEWIDKQLSEHCDPEFAPKAAALGDARRGLRAAWLHHVRHHNHPLPIETRIGHDGAPAAGQGLSGETDLLYEAGFSEVACPFRYLQAGILWARK